MSNIEDSTDWDVAPAQHQIYSSDEIKITYRLAVSEIPKKTKTLLKKPFFTISTNVLCADTETKYLRYPPVQRDIYLPLEISITKWTINDAKEGVRTRKLNNKTWMINPGPAPYESKSRAMDHRDTTHKIDFDPDDVESPHVEADYSKVVKEINSFLSPDRTVFSLELRNVRQDLGCIKWLNREVNYRMKPVKVLSIVDLYVVLLRHFNPDTGYFIGEGMAKYRMGFNSLYLDETCKYHQIRAEENPEKGSTQFCARVLSLTWTHALLNDLKTFGRIFDDNEK